MSGILAAVTSSTTRVCSSSSARLSGELLASRAARVLVLVLLLSSACTENDAALGPSDGGADAATSGMDASRPHVITRDSTVPSPDAEHDALPDPDCVDRDCLC